MNTARIILGVGAAEQTLASAGLLVHAIRPKTFGRPRATMGERIGYGVVGGIVGLTATISWGVVAFGPWSSTSTPAK